MYGRPNAITGDESLNPWIDAGNAPCTVPTSCGPPPKSILRSFVSSASDASGAKVCVSSVRSLLAPGRRTIWRRSATVGLRSWMNGWSWSRNGLSFTATGFDALTSGSTSLSVERRFTNVVFERRMKAGRRVSASESAAFCWPIAPSVEFRLTISCERSSRRLASAVTSRALSWTKLSSRGVSALSSLKRRREVDSAGFRYWNPTFSIEPLSLSAAAWPLKKCWSALRVGGSSVLKSWSRSTLVVVLSALMRPPSWIFGAAPALFGIVRST